MDVMVLGAGIIGLSTALELQNNRVNVVLVDKESPCRAASYGNAGMIHGEAAFPMPFPRKVSELFRYALNRHPAAHYHLKSLPVFAPFLYGYWQNSSPKRHLETARQYSKLTLASREDHLALATLCDANHLYKDDGCYMIFKSEKELAGGLEEAEQAKTHFDIQSRTLTEQEFSQIEPNVNGVYGAIHWSTSLTVNTPGALCERIFDKFISLGGSFIKADASQLVSLPNGWVIKGSKEVSAEKLVIALGARSAKLSASLGYKAPLKPKRGYHAHFGLKEGVSLNNTLIDRERGFSIAPMQSSVRMTTGIEFADIDAPPSPVQMESCEAHVRSFIAVKEKVQEPLWMGERPCLPDMLPVIGPAPERDDLWFAFGHAHQGLTMGPTTGKLIRQLMLEKTSEIDPYPFRIDRFLG